jgi:predicted O-methyltransferase YrrM
MQEQSDSAAPLGAAPGFRRGSTTPRWRDQRTFDIDGVEFVYSFAASSSSRHFAIRKPRPLVESTLALLDQLGSQRIVELGIASGGSTALLALAGRPDRLVAIELDEQRVEALDDLVRERGIGNQIRPYYGIDQSDASGLHTIVADEFGGAPLDLVIDDASHRYLESRASFEVLFPYLRPGGMYVIEDWNWQLQFAYAVAGGSHTAPSSARDPDAPHATEELRDRVADYARQNWSTPPLERLVLEIVLARACAHDVIGHVAVDAHQVTVERGAAILNGTEFRLSDAYVPAAQVLG